METGSMACLNILKTADAEGVFEDGVVVFTSVGQKPCSAIDLSTLTAPPSTFMKRAIVAQF
jgi:hypothetical protein